MLTLEWDNTYSKMRKKEVRFCVRRKTPAGQASKAPELVTVTVAEGSAGFTCDNKLGVTSVTPGGASDAAGVLIGMRLHAFQGAARPAQETRVLVWCSAQS